MAWAARNLISTQARLSHINRGFAFYLGEQALDRLQGRRRSRSRPTLKPPVWVVEKLHANGTLVMNMAGLPRHVEKALETGVDIICASGTEGGAHTGDVSTLVLVPQCADMCKGRAVLVGAGGIFDGRGVAACMALGAQGCWIGTRFLATWESNSTEGNKTAILEASSNDTRRIEIYSGRPLRVIKNKYNDEWAANEGKMRELLDKGIVPVQHEIAEGRLKKNFFGVRTAPRTSCKSFMLLNALE